MLSLFCDFWNEWRVSIKFYLKLGKNVADTHWMFQQTFGDPALCRVRLLEWFIYLGGVNLLEMTKDHVDRRLTQLQRCSSMYMKLYSKKTTQQRLVSASRQYADTHHWWSGNQHDKRFCTLLLARICTVPLFSVSKNETLAQRTPFWFCRNNTNGTGRCPRRPNSWFPALSPIKTRLLEIRTSKMTSLKVTIKIWSNVNCLIVYAQLVTLGNNQTSITDSLLPQTYCIYPNTLIHLMIKSIIRPSRLPGNHNNPLAIQLFGISRQSPSRHRRLPRRLIRTI